MKKKEIENQNEEEIVEEEEVNEEEEQAKEEEETKKMEAEIEKKISKAIQDIRENSVKSSFNYKREDATVDKSVMEENLILRRKRPFIKLSKAMEDFVADIKDMARGVVKTTPMTEGTPSQGGYLVPEEFQAELVRYVEEASIVRPRARVWNMTRDKVNIPKLDQSSSSFGGATLYWPGEGGLKTLSRPALGQIQLNAQKVIGLASATDELLADSAVNVANFLVTLFGEAIAYEEDKKFIQGSGSNEPLGIMEYDGTSVVARNTSSKILIEDVLALDENFPAWAEQGNVVWLTSKKGKTQLRQLGRTSTTFNQVWMESMRAGDPPTLLGHPVLFTEKVDTTIGNSGDIILANLSWYYVGDRGGLEVTSSIHDRFRYDETVFRFVKRVDGQPAVAKAFAMLGK